MPSLQYENQPLINFEIVLTKHFHIKLGMFYNSMCDFKLLLQMFFKTFILHNIIQNHNIVSWDWQYILTFS